MALAAGPLTPIRERGEGADGEGGSGDDQQDKGETWEGTEPLGGSAAGKLLPSSEELLPACWHALYWSLCLCLLPPCVCADGLWQKYRTHLPEITNLSSLSTLV